LPFTYIGLICLLLQPFLVFPALYRCPCPFSVRVRSNRKGREGRFLLKIDTDVWNYTASYTRRQYS